MDEQFTAEELVSEMPTMVIDRKTYVVDSALRELRNVFDPRDRIVFSK